MSVSLKRRPDGGISILDDSLGIDWRIPTEHANLSEKDTKHEVLKDIERILEERALPKNIEVIFFESLRLPLAKGSSTSNQAFLLRRKDVTALRCSEPLRSMDGGPSKVYAMFCGLGPPYYNLLLVFAIFCGLGPPGEESL